MTEHRHLEGLSHVSAQPIDKNFLLTMLRDAFGIEIEIEPDDSVAIDRSLDSSRFRRITGWEPLIWQEMIIEMVADSMPYDEIRRSKPC